MNTKYSICPDCGWTWWEDLQGRTSSLHQCKDGAMKCFAPERRGMKTLQPKPEYLPQDKPDPSRLDTFSKPTFCTRVTLICKEVTSLCPITQQPDFATVTITYHPKDLCLESKSLKEYLFGYRSYGNFCEAMASKIAEDVITILKAHSVLVEIEFASRGGIIIISRGEMK